MLLGEGGGGGGHNWWQTSIDSGDGLAPTGDKPLPEPMVA